MNARSQSRRLSQITALALLGLSVARAQAATTHVFQYDSSGRLTNVSYGARAIAYAYDAGGNLLERRASGGPAPEADLALVLQGESATLEAGRGNLVFTLAVSNAGPAAAENVLVRDPLPADTVFAAAGAGAEAGGVFEAALGNLAAGAQTSVWLELVPLATGTFVNAATVTNAAADPQPANNFAAVTNVVVRAADTNANGLADWWEVRFFTNPADRVAGGDFDEDRIPNVDEQNAGTDPTLDSSRPVVRVDSYPAPFVVGFDAASGRVYHVDWSSNLPSGLWQNLRSNVPGRGIPAAAADTNGEALIRHYRMRIQSP